MADNWGESPAASTEGRTFGKGRGFSRNNENDNWGENNSNDRGWGSENGSGGDGGRRDTRNFRGNRRDNGDRNNGRRSNNDDNDYNDGESHRRNDRNDGNNWSRKTDSWGSQENSRNSNENYRGGRNRDDRGGRNNNSDGDGENENGENEEKRPPIYVPKERTVDELFEDAGISKGINFDDYKNIAVEVSGNDPPRPIISFADANFRSIIMDNLRRTKYDEPTPIQKYAISVVLNGRDLMGIAQTGSGKTAAFLLPIIHTLLANQSNESDGGAACHPQAVILSPTRELTTQIYEVARKFCTNSILKVHQIYGGTSCGYQIKQISNGCDILIATPGRLGDFLGRGVISFKSVKFVVLDEADRMLDMGFRVQLETFFNHETMPSTNRQTLMFSATFSKDIQNIASNYMNDYVFLSVGIVGGACKDVAQEFIAVSKKEKKRKLKELLKEQDDVKGTLLFVETKRTADFIASYLSDESFPTTSIHGDRFQSQREEALRDFKSRRMSILVATSVAARGLDIKGVTHVINYDLPDSVDEYVHRIGRTGRLGNKGRATSFYDADSEDRKIVNDLVQILKNAGQSVPEFLSRDCSGRSSYGKAKFGGYDYRYSKNVEEEPETNTSSTSAPANESEEW